VLGGLRDKGSKCHPAEMRVRFPGVDYLGHKVVPSGTALMTVEEEAFVKISVATNRRSRIESCLRDC
jgi:hypothetical protein